MKIITISDQHGFLPAIEPCDILIIAGDIVPLNVQNSHFESMKWLSSDFKEWLEDMPAKDIVATPGNHDFIFSHSPSSIPRLRWHLLIDKDTTVQGLKIYASPYQLWFWDWAFNAPDGPEGEVYLDKKFSMISHNTDIIISHGPPYGYGDLTDRGEKVGSKSLLKHIERVKPKLTVSGHIHSGYGEYDISYSNNTTGKIVNASVLNEKYQLTNKPIVVNL